MTPIPFGLQLASAKFEPIFGAKVELIDKDNPGTPLGTTITKDHGGFAINYKVAKQTNVIVRIYAVSKHVTIEHFDKKDIHAISSEFFAIDKGNPQPIVLKATDKENEAGAFNILEAVRRADKFVEDADPGIAGQLYGKQITVKWTAGKYPNGTSRFDPDRNLAFIKGNRDFTPPEDLSAALRKDNPKGLPGDCDEFDDYVIIHEYGHFLWRNFCDEGFEKFANDGYSWYGKPPRNYHATGLNVDPRLAFSEGWANFFACAVIGDPRYVDTGRDSLKKDDSILSMDLDENIPKGELTGHGSEHVVGSVLWDFFDKSKAKEGDLHLGLGFGEIWRVSMKLQGRRNVTLIDFCDILVDNRPELAAKVNEILASRKVKHKTGPAAGDDAHYHLSISGEREGRLDSRTTRHYADFEDAAFYILKVDKKSRIKIDLKIVMSNQEENADLDIFLYHLGKVYSHKNDATKVGETESIILEMEPGVHSIEVRSWYPLQNTTTGELTGKLRGNTATFRLKATVETK